jgi:DNA-binding NtrC family response regulator
MAVSTRVSGKVIELAQKLEAGNYDEVVQGARELEEMFSKIPLTAANVLTQKGRALTPLRRFGEAKEAFESARVASHRSGILGNLPEIELCDGQRAHEAGETGEAIRLARRAFERGLDAGKIFIVWQALYLQGRAFEKDGRPGRAAKSFRRALWALEAELMAFPEPFRSSFEGKKDVSALLSRGSAIRAEEAALRAARWIGRSIVRSKAGWMETARQWAAKCAGLLGAKGIEIHARWADPEVKVVTWGERAESDDCRSIPFGEGGTRPGRVELRRSWDRGPFPPVGKRIEGVLVGRLSNLLEREEREELERKFERFKRMRRPGTAEAETLLDSALAKLSRTQLALSRARGYGEMVGTSRAMRAVYEWVRRWGPEEAALVITGESGTGKELVARAVHLASRRHSGPFFAVNCAAVAESLLESEIFGHEKGAFTGADEASPGLFELTSGGTLVLDEVADMSPRMQAALLRVLEEGKIRRVGGMEKIDVDVRVVALANRDLQGEVGEGRFRPDLLHRLDGASLVLPPLRKRKEDIPRLAGYFLTQFRGEGEKRKITGSVKAVLMKYRWPGNVRELRNQIQRASVLAQGRTLRPADFPQLASVPVTRSSLSEGLLAALREAAARSGTELVQRHHDLFRVLAAGGSIRRGEYERLASISARTANRDLERFVAWKLLTKVGRGRGTAYRLALRTGQ